jgi:Holliday junction resolvase RusA-like endonuclease
MPTFVLVIPHWRPPLANEWRGRHWSVAHRLRKRAADLLGTYALAQRVPKATCRRSVAVEVVLGPRQRQPDRDSMDKLLLDAVVEAGLLLDDSDRGLAGRVEVTFRRGDASAWGTVVTLTDLKGE